MIHRQALGWSFLILLSSSSLISTLAYPNHPQQQQQHQQIHQSATVPNAPSRTPQLPSVRVERKFAEKPNAIKKVALDNLDDISTNEIGDSGPGNGGGFTWSNLLGMVMQMFFSPAAAQQGPNKSEGLDDGVAPSPWANLLAVGLKILTAILGGGAGAGGDGIDKVDNGSPMQGILAALFSTFMGSRDPQQVNMMAKQAGEFINIVVTLLDALKTSFSHRSMAARSIGRKDSISDATVAGISMMKGYMRSMSTVEDSCMQKYMCDANRECSRDIGRSSIFCQLGTYAASFMVERSAGSNFDLLYEAGRRGRSGDNCQQAFVECNEI